MSYTRPRASRQALGASAEEIVAAMAKIAKYATKLPQYANTIAEVIDDPYLPELACRVDQIYAANQKLPVSPCANTAGSPRSPLFQKAMPVVRGVAYAEQHAWVYPAFFGALFGIPAVLGYVLGRDSR